MKMINPKSLKNGKPEWACLTCVDPAFVQTSAETILFPNSAKHFDGVLKEGDLCGYCHLAGGSLVCDECKADILSVNGYGGNIGEVDILKHKIKIQEDQFFHYSKNPLIGLEKEKSWKRHDLIQHTRKLKLDVLNFRLNELRKQGKGQHILYDKPKLAKYRGHDSSGDYVEKTTVVIGEDNLSYIESFYDSEEHDTTKENYGQKIQCTNGFHKSRLIEWVDEAKDKKTYSIDWEGNEYFWDEADKEWLIHDGKSKLYTVSDQELIDYLNERKFNR
jgi:hypothetical protein